MTERLFQADAAPANVVIAGGRLVDPAAGFHGEAVDVRIEDGRIAEIGRDLQHPDAETIDASGLTVTPGLVDPHVHLRTPGDEEEEDIASGTRAAAAGGFVAILAMPNTSPVVDSAAVLTGLIDTARTQAVVATGFMCAITAGQLGRRLTEMGELADAGAAAFSDDGRPVADAGILRRALQYCSITGLKLALHEEDTSLSAGGQMHEGAVSAELGLRGWPGIAESTMIARDLGLARHEGAPLHICHVSVADSVAEIRRARERGAQVSAEVTPHHLCLTDESVRALDPATSKMNPPLRIRGRSGRADRGAGGRHARLHRDRPRPPPRPREGRSLRGGAVRGDRPRDRLRRGLHPPGRAGPRAAADGDRADVVGAGDGIRPARARCSRWAVPPIWRCGIWERRASSSRRTPRARRTARSPARRSAACAA